MFKSLAKRFSEPSSWAGVAALAGALGLAVDPGLMQSITLIGAGVAGVASVFLPEGK